MRYDALRFLGAACRVHNCSTSHDTDASSPQGATRALVVKFADVKKAHTAKGWMGPDGRGASPLGFNGGMRHANVGGVGGYWAATAPGGRDVFSKGREVYPDYVNRGYPYQVSRGKRACVRVHVCVYIWLSH